MGEGLCLSSVISVGYADQEHPVNPFFFCFHFYKGKGGLSGEQPHATFFMLYCFVLFCKLYNF